MKNKTYYDILDVARNASPTEIKRAYYSLCKRYHPDINPGALELFKEINQAYETLYNPVTRREYDAVLNNPNKTYNSNQSNYTYDNYQAYQYDPKHDPIIVILNNFSMYKTENATSAIWKRNIFILLGNTIYLGLLPVFSLLHLLCMKTLKRAFISPNARKIKCLNNLHIRIQEQKYLKYFVFSLILTCFTISKAIYHIFNIIMFTYNKILKPLFIPLAIILTGFIINSKKNK